MFIKNNINTRFNMQMTSNTQRTLPLPVVQTTRVLKQSSRAIVKPMLIATQSQKKGCRSCGS